MIQNFALDSIDWMMHVENTILVWCVMAYFSDSGDNDYFHWYTPLAYFTVKANHIESMPPSPPLNIRKYFNSGEQLHFTHFNWLSYYNDSQKKKAPKFDGKKR